MEQQQNMLIFQSLPRTYHELISRSKRNRKQMKMNTLDRYRKIKHYLRQKNAEKKLFHPASILCGYSDPMSKLLSASREPHAGV